MSNMFKRMVFATGIFPPDIGGPAVYVSRLADEFVKKGFNVDVVTFSDAPISGRHDFPVAGISRSYPKGLRHFLFFWKLLGVSRNKDVIYVQNQISAGLPALLVSKILKKKLVLKVVGDAAWENYATGRHVFDGIDDFQNKDYGFFVQLLKKLRSTVSKNSDKIIVPSNYLKNIVLKWGVESEKISVVYNALDSLNELNISKEQAKKRINISGNVILSIGRLCPWKGFGALVELMPDLLKHNQDFKLVIVGKGQERENLARRIKELGLESSVRLTGKVDHRDIGFYFKAADIFVLNSEYEGLPHVALEAMQADVPMILSDTGGNPEVVENGFNGFLVQYNNERQLRRSIVRLYGDKNLQRTFIENSKLKLKKFSWDSLVVQTADIIFEQ